jgi:hypothetical protein
MLRDEELDLVGGGTCTCATGGDCDRSSVE